MNNENLFVALAFYGVVWCGLAELSLHSRVFAIADALAGGTPAAGLLLWRGWRQL